MQLIRQCGISGAILGIIYGAFMGILLNLLNAPYIDTFNTFILICLYAIVFFLLFGLGFGCFLGIFINIYHWVGRKSKSLQSISSSKYSNLIHPYPFFMLQIILLLTSIQYLLLWDRWKQFQNGISYNQKIIFFIGIGILLFVLIQLCHRYQFLKLLNIGLNNQFQKIFQSKYSLFHQWTWKIIIFVVIGLLFSYTIVVYGDDSQANHVRSFDRENLLDADEIFPDENQEETKLKPNILFVGWDGADWKVLEPLIKEGKLPNLKKLLDKGAKGSLQTIKPTLSPAIWTTIITGKRPIDHEILNFMIIGEILGSNEVMPIVPLNQMISTPEYVLFAPISLMIKGNARLGLWKLVVPDSGDRTTKTIWRIANEHGITSGIIHLMVTTPPEPVNGYILGNSLGNTMDDNIDSIYPKELLPVINKISSSKNKLSESGFNRLFDNPSFAREMAESKEPRDKIYFEIMSRMFMEDYSKSQLMFELTRIYHPDMTMIYYQGPDLISHVFWKYLFPNDFWFIPEKDVQRYHQVIPGYFQFLDEQLGKMIESSGPDTITVLCSDHGFESDSPIMEKIYMLQGRLSSGDHRKGPPGIIVISGNSVIPGSRLDEASIMDITPTLLWLLDIPIGNDMPGTPLTDIFDSKFKGKKPLTRISSHDSIKLTNKRLPKTRNRLDKKLEERLRSLGYIQ